MYLHYYLKPEAHLIDWLLLNVQRAVEQLFSGREQVVIYINYMYMEMKEGVGQSSQRLLTGTEKVWRVG